jgi:hypothetical protein
MLKHPTRANAHLCLAEEMAACLELVMHHPPLPPTYPSHTHGALTYEDKEVVYKYAGVNEEGVEANDGLHQGCNGAHTGMDTDKIMKKHMLRGSAAGWGWGWGRGWRSECLLDTS